MGLAVVRAGHGGLLTEMGASVLLDVHDEPEHVVTDAAIASTRALLVRAAAGRNKPGAAGAHPSEPQRPSAGP